MDDLVLGTSHLRMKESSVDTAAPTATATQKESRALPPRSRSVGALADKSNKLDPPLSRAATTTTTKREKSNERRTTLSNLSSQPEQTSTGLNRTLPVTRSTGRGAPDRTPFDYPDLSSFSLMDVATLNHDGSQEEDLPTLTSTPPSHHPPLNVRNIELDLNAASVPDIFLDRPKEVEDLSSSPDSSNRTAVVPHRLAEETIILKAKAPQQQTALLPEAPRSSRRVRASTSSGIIDSSSLAARESSASLDGDTVLDAHLSKLLRQTLEISRSGDGKEGKPRDSPIRARAASHSVNPKGTAFPLVGGTSCSSEQETEGEEEGKESPRHPASDAMEEEGEDDHDTLQLPPLLSSTRASGSMSAGLRSTRRDSKGSGPILSRLKKKPSKEHHMQGGSRGIAEHQVGPSGSSTAFSKTRSSSSEVSKAKVLHRQRDGPSDLVHGVPSSRPPQAAGKTAARKKLSSTRGLGTAILDSPALANSSGSADEIGL